MTEVDLNQTICLQITTQSNTDNMINILNIFLLITCLYSSYRLIIISIMVKNNLKIHRISKNHNPNND